jgi:hypothetical protein
LSGPASGCAALRAEGYRRLWHSSPNRRLCFRREYSWRVSSSRLPPDDRVEGRTRFCQPGTGGDPPLCSSGSATRESPNRSASAAIGTDSGARLTRPSPSVTALVIYSFLMGFGDVAIIAFGPLYLQEVMTWPWPRERQRSLVHWESEPGYSGVCWRSVASACGSRPPRLDWPDHPRHHPCHQRHHREKG